MRFGPTTAGVKREAHLNDSMPSHGRYRGRSQALSASTRSNVVLLNIKSNS